MTLEADIITLTGKVQDLLGKVDTTYKQLALDVTNIRRSIPYEFIVSTRIPASETVGPNIADVQRKIAERRATEPNGADPLTWPRPVSVLVESVEAVLPVNLTEHNVEWVLQYGVVFNLQEGQTVFTVQGRNVTINGGTFRYAARNDARNFWLRTAPERRTIVRRGIFINTDEAGAEGIDLGFALDNVKY